MKKIGLVLTGTLLIFICSVLSVSSGERESLNCPRTKIVLQHKELAIKLTFSGVPSPIVDEKNSSLRCQTAKEVIDMIMEISPDYYLVEYSENSK